MTAFTNCLIVILTLCCTGCGKKEDPPLEPALPASEPPPAKKLTVWDYSPESVLKFVPTSIGDYQMMIPEEYKAVAFRDSPKGSFAWRSNNNEILTVLLISDPQSVARLERLDFRTSIMNFTKGYSDSSNPDYGPAEPGLIDGMPFVRVGWTAKLNGNAIKGLTYQTIDNSNFILFMVVIPSSVADSTLITLQTSIATFKKAK